MIAGLTARMTYDLFNSVADRVEGPLLLCGPPKERAIDRTEAVVVATERLRGTLFAGQA